MNLINVSIWWKTAHFLAITVLPTFDFLILPLRFFTAILHPNGADR